MTNIGDVTNMRAQGLLRGDFLEAVSDVSIRQYFTQFYAVGLSV